MLFAFSDYIAFNAMKYFFSKAFEIPFPLLILSTIENNEEKIGISQQEYRKLEWKIAANENGSEATARIRESDAKTEK